MVVQVQNVGSTGVPVTNPEPEAVSPRLPRSGRRVLSGLNVRTTHRQRSEGCNVCVRIGLGRSRHTGRRVHAGSRTKDGCKAQLRSLREN